MESTKPPFDPSPAAAVVASAIEELDTGDEDQGDTLLYELVCAAWGSIRGMDH